MAQIYTNGDQTNGSSGSMDWTFFRNVINGELTHTKETRHGINPATGKANPEVPVSTPEDVDRAMEAAQKAFPGWAATPMADRQKAVEAFADALESEREAFAKMLTQEQGKPVSSSVLFAYRTHCHTSFNSRIWNSTLLLVGSGRLRS